ncbi:hypothetical protein HPC49_05365 [Pyxidicoccus fallax]|uniref:Lipoprotein n=1 Tax=Pyxidicoccus fallax TaxID=394095 RepID=A0A848LEN9_9BACT|nr:hypothetical protein [Pyxidicoccus fallax]NMO14721.1 hypothetical protein [Pyxidicoccus fallax]NPC77682.1 hypothetical protein [Pyxidicoccus fallax]
MGMRAFVVASLALALAWAPSAGAEEAVALIWKGSKNKADVESLEPTWNRLEALLSAGGVTLPEGFPKLVESRTVRGLKPGFWVWVVGFCPGDDGERAMELLKIVAPDTYARDVNIPSKKLACPEVDGASLAEDSHSFKLSRERTLRVFTHEESQEPEGDAPGDSYTRTHYTFALMDKAGAVLDTASAVGEERFSGDVRQGPSGYHCQVSDFTHDGELTVEFVRSCSATIAECGSVVSRDEVTFLTVAGDRLKTREGRRNEERMECGED